MAVKIGILGGIRSGKDTVAQMIVEEFAGQHVELYAFSSGIHGVIQRYFPHIYKEGKPREALQQIGQLFRQFDADVWINHLFNKIETTYDFLPMQDRHIIITDVRQPNEAKRLQEAGYTIIKVVADKRTRLQRARRAGDNFTEDMFNHETEILIEQCNYDLLIENTGTLEELKTKVQKALDKADGGYQ